MTTTNPAPTEELRASVEGTVIEPGDAAYDEARGIWNGMIDRRPAAIVRCAGAADVSEAIRFARAHDLPIAVRGGGHGVAGNALVDDGLVIDLSAMRAVDVDPERRVAHAEGGCTLGDVDRETQRFGLAAPLGVVSETGIAGLTLSGGLGWLRRLHGLSCDNLIAAEVVTAEGEVLRASEDENPDLFWAIRGGGGNLGVVTSFEYRLHPVGPEVFLCFTIYPIADAEAVIRGCERHLADGREELSPVAVIGRVPAADEIPADAHGRECVIVLAVHPGAPEEGEREIAPLRELAEPLADLSGAMPYVEAQTCLDEDYPRGGRYYWKSVNLPEMSDAAIERLVAINAATPASTPDSTIDVWFQGGAMARVGETETAFANRGAAYLIGLEANAGAGEDATDAVAWVRAAFDDLRELSDGGVYLNFPGFLEEGEELLREGYGRNYERLAEVKAKYDPENVFRLNPNVAPAGAAAGG